MCLGVGPSGLPMLMSMMSSPARRAAIFNSLVMLKTYGGRRWMRANSLMVAGGLIGLGASISNRAAAQKVIMLPDTYITGKLETPPRSRLRAERLHRLRPGLREGQRPAHREKCGGPARTHHRGLARDELRDARARASRRARRPGARDRSAGHRGAAALSPPRDHAAARSVRHRRRSDGRGGRLPDLQHPGGRRAQGGGGAAARVKTCPSSVFSIHWAPACAGTAGLMPGTLPANDFTTRTLAVACRL